MTRYLKSTLTLLVLLLLLLTGATWGYQALTEPMPGAVQSPPCTNWTMTKGSKIYPDQVTVTVYNAGSRGGLAGRTMEALVDLGFSEGDMGNAEDGVKVRTAQIWAPAKGDPAAQLLRTYVGPRIGIFQRKDPSPGIVLVVGDDFGSLVKGRKWVRVPRDTVVCSPENAQE